jgi:hypothetical protein
VGVTKRDVLLLVSACLFGCKSSNDMVLQPDTAAGSGMPAAGMGGGMAGASSSGTGGSGGTAGTTGQPPAAASGNGGTGGQTPAAGTGGAAGKAGAAGTAAAGTGGAAGGVASGTGGASGEGGESGTGGGEGGAAGEGAMMGAADPECDFTGIWIGKQVTVSEAEGIPVPATSNNWYYLEFKQSGTNVEVSKHYDCGIEVTGSVTVTVNRQTLEALLSHNIQTGRKATLVKDGTNCKFESERFWSIRGADEMQYLPSDGRSSLKSIDEVAAENPLPTMQKPDGAIDLENDGKKGVAFQASGIISGTRNSVQRDWTKWFTEPGFEIKATADWKDDLKVRADFDNEESIIDAPGLLAAGSTPKSGTKHLLRLRFLGRDASDPRVAQIVKATQTDTCFAIQDAIPAETLE